MKKFLSVFCTFVFCFNSIGVAFSEQLIQDNNVNSEQVSNSKTILKRANSAQSSSSKDGGMVKKLELDILDNEESKTENGNEVIEEVVFNGEIEESEKSEDKTEEALVENTEILQVEERKVEVNEEKTEEVKSDVKAEVKEAKEVKAEGKTEVKSEIIPESKTEVKNQFKLIKKERSIDDKRQAYISYAYEKGGMDLVTLIECENAERSIDRKAGGTEESYGFCQINKRWHKDILNDSRFWTDWKWQIDRCYELMKGGTPFYGRGKLMGGKRCDVIVRSRFQTK